MRSTRPVGWGSYGIDPFACGPPQEEPALNPNVIGQGKDAKGDQGHDPCPRDETPQGSSGRSRLITIIPDLSD